jgi:hypothetical protein
MRVASPWRRGAGDLYGELGDGSQSRKETRGLAGNETKLGAVPGAVFGVEGVLHVATACQHKSPVVKTEPRGPSARISATRSAGTQDRRCFARRGHRDDSCVQSEPHDECSTLYRPSGRHLVGATEDSICADGA